MVHVGFCPPSEEPGALVAPRCTSCVQVEAAGGRWRLEPALLPAPRTEQRRLRGRRSPTANRKHFRSASCSRGFGSILERAGAEGVFLRMEEEMYTVSHAEEW